jgi:hypothetical protein
MKPPLIILLLVSALLFNSCDREAKHVSIPPATKKQLSFTGDWEHSFPFFSGSLVLESRGKFRFFESGCLGQRYSEGLWATDGTFVTLNSFDEFKETPQLITEELSHESFSGFSEIVGDSLVLKVRNIDLPVHRASLPDTTYEYFNNQRFVLQQDTLYELDKNALLTGRKFCKRRIVIEAKL